MKKLGLIIGIGAIAVIAACSEGAVTTNNGSVTVNTTVIGEDIQNGAADTGNFARNSAKAIGNGLGRAGQVISNNAKAAWNEVKEAARELRGDEGNASGNSSGN